MGVIKAFRVGGIPFDLIWRHWVDGTADSLPAAVLVDSHRDGEPGGTGTRLDPAAAIAARMAVGSCPFVLAGGLDPANVAQAIGDVRPDAVDVASGIEAAPGIKDPELLRRFMEQVRQGIQESSLRHPIDRPKSGGQDGLVRLE